jgi:hypothetical protein
VNELHLKAMRQERERAERALESAQGPAPASSPASPAASQAAAHTAVTQPAVAEKTGAAETNGVAHTTRYDG